MLFVPTQLQGSLSKQNDPRLDENSFVTASDEPWFSIVELFVCILLLAIGMRLFKRALNARSAQRHQHHLNDKQHPTKF